MIYASTSLFEISYRGGLKDFDMFVRLWKGIIPKGGESTNLKMQL